MELQVWLCIHTTNHKLPDKAWAGWLQFSFRTKYFTMRFIKNSRTVFLSEESDGEECFHSAGYLCVALYAPTYMHRHARTYTTNTVCSLTDSNISSVCCCCKCKGIWAERKAVSCHGLSCNNKSFLHPDIVEEPHLVLTIKLKVGQDCFHFIYVSIMPLVHFHLVQSHFLKVLKEKLEGVISEKGLNVPE